MKYTIKILLLMAIALSVSACGFEVVPPATKGKILTTSGYAPDVLEPGNYTLWGRDKLIILETNTNTYTEKVVVVLADKLTLTVDIRFRGRIAGNDKVISAMFNDIAAGDDKTVAFNEVYRIYGQMTIRNKTREIISKYTVEDVHKNYGRLSGEIGKVLTVALEGTPLEISDIAVGSIAYPKVVNDAINAAKERELAIKKEEAQAAIELVKKKNERILAEADYQIKITRAKAVRDANKIMGDGITPQLIEIKRIDVLKAMTKNNSVVFMPVEGMSSVGAQMRMFGK